MGLYRRDLILGSIGSLEFGWAKAIFESFIHGGEGYFWSWCSHITKNFKISLFDDHLRLAAKK